MEKQVRVFIEWASGKVDSADIPLSVWKNTVMNILEEADNVVNYTAEVIEV